ncbi:MAG: MBL fold metallo-hydrolase [Acidobacteria bacterium]|nr:MBL fold metallo-hydrolase [Acidobacteriota bacterium]
MGIATAGGLVAAAYRASPMFWSRVAEDVRRDVLSPPRIPDPSKWPSTGIHAAWLGHSTVLMKIDGMTVITDPVFSNRAGIDLWIATLGIKRLVHPALPVRKLPKIDLILLSHAHMDHFDLPSLRALEGPDTQVITASQTSDLLRVDRYQRVSEAGWGTAVQVGPLRVSGFEVKHWGARIRSDTWRGYNGYVIETGRYRVMFGGDTAFTTSFAQVKQSKPVNLAIMPIGAYNPWIRAHCNPEQALKMADLAGAEAVLPVHHKTFKLSHEPVNEPIDRLVTAAGSSADRVVVKDIGHEVHLG